MQGFNMGRYVPPEIEGTVTSGNKVIGKHPLGHRASKLKTEGILVVRFAAPFPIWCNHCLEKNPKAPVIIGKGTRFNAEKKTVGSYHSSPIISFRIKHTICGNWIEIRTDPQNADYVVYFGGKRRDLGDEDENAAEKTLEAERERRNEDAFAALEGRNNDKQAFLDSEGRVKELKRKSDRDWKHDYENNEKLQAKYRAERRILDQEAKVTEALRDKHSLSIKLLPEEERDAIKAKQIEFEKPRDRKANLSKEAQAKRRLRRLRRGVVRNTRQSMNPFNLAQRSRPDQLLIEDAPREQDDAGMLVDDGLVIKAEPS